MGPTPLERAPDGLGDGRELLLKREDVHELGAFKWRGALPTVEGYRAAGADLVVTASTGNHGAATAWAAERAGVRAVVFAPEGAVRAKVDLIETLGAEIRLTGADLDEAKIAARAFAEERRAPFFEDGAERSQYEGYGAIGEEILDALGGPPATIVAPVGNGALLGGIGIAVCRRSPETERVGVASKGAPCMVLSWDEGEPLATDTAATFADGLAVRVAIPFAVDMLGEVASRMILVSEREIARGVAAFAAAGIRVEGAAAAGLAALAQLDELDGPTVLVVTGRNIDEDVFRRALEEPESFPD